MALDGGRNATGDRHHSMEAAFAVPAAQNGRRGLTEASVGIPVLNARWIAESSQPRSDSFERAYASATCRRVRLMRRRDHRGKVDA
jgi:hypothetical protein